jgi:hypothetical protein
MYEVNENMQHAGGSWEVLTKILVAILEGGRSLARSKDRCGDNIHVDVK